MDGIVPALATLQMGREAADAPLHAPVVGMR